MYAALLAEQPGLIMTLRTHAPLYLLLSGDVCHSCDVTHDDLGRFCFPRSALSCKYRKYCTVTRTVHVRMIQEAQGHIPVYICCAKRTTSLKPRALYQRRGRIAVYACVGRGGGSINDNDVNIRVAAERGGLAGGRQSARHTSAFIHGPPSSTHVGEANLLSNSRL